MDVNNIELSKVIKDIAAGPFGSNLKVSCFVDYGFPIIDGANLKGFKVTDNITKYVTEEKARSLQRSIAKRGDVVVTISGTLGQIAYIPEDSKFEEYLVSQRQFRVTFDSEQVYVPYLVFYFHTYEGQQKILSFANQVGVPALAQPLKNFKKLCVNFPSIEVQHKIANVIESINSKIETNNQINQNLEQQAQALYSDFISKTESSPVNVEQIILSANTGADAIQKAPIVDENTGVRCIRVGDMTNHRPYYDWGYTKVTPEVFNQYQLHKDDIVVTRTAKLGLNTLIPCDLNAVYNNGLIRLVINKQTALPIIVYREFQTGKYSNYIDCISGETSVRPNMKINYLLKYSFLLPSIDQQQQLSQALQPLYDAQQAYITESQKLSELRDSLLPKLMAGELDVSNIEI